MHRIWFGGERFLNYKLVISAHFYLPRQPLPLFFIPNIGVVPSDVVSSCAYYFYWLVGIPLAALNISCTKQPLDVVVAENQPSTTQLPHPSAAVQKLERQFSAWLKLENRCRLVKGFSQRPNIVDLQICTQQHGNKIGVSPTSYFFTPTCPIKCIRVYVHMSIEMDHVH